MSRLLSELLGAREPLFHQKLTSLECASGRSSTDIRLSADIERLSKQKLQQLGLDPADTTAEELYGVLQGKVHDDDARLRATLRVRYNGRPMHSIIAEVLTNSFDNRMCFALKTAVARRLIRATPPRRIQKLLGYRSFDSMMRREPLLAIFGAAWSIESSNWRRMMLDNYCKLLAGDFELRKFSIVAPQPDRWQNVSNEITREGNRAVVGLREFGAVIVLPLAEPLQHGMSLAALLFALHESNEVCAASMYLKLCQVRLDFGRCVRQVIVGDPYFHSVYLDGPVPWQAIQRSFARYKNLYSPSILGSHIQTEDLSWLSIEKALQRIEPTLAFWRHAAFVGLLQNHQTVSFSILDAVQNFCNHVPFEQRVTAYLRRNLWQELIVRYMRYQPAELSVLGELEPETAIERAI